jgi:hypothetical protein
LGWGTISAPGDEPGFVVAIGELTLVCPIAMPSFSSSPWIHYALYEHVAGTSGAGRSPTAAIIDSQSVKSAEKEACIDPHGTMRARRSRASSGTFLLQ